MQHGWKLPAVGSSTGIKFRSITLEAAATQGRQNTQISSHIKCHKSQLSSASGYVFFRQEPSCQEKRFLNIFCQFLS